MRKFLISKDTKDSKDSKDTKDTKDSKVINKKATNKDPDTSQNIQFPLKRVLHETTNSSTLIQKDIKPLNKFKIQKEKNNIQENLTKIQKLSYLMRETEYFNLPTTATPAEEEDIDIRTSSRARREENIEIVTENENRNNEVNDDGKMIEIIAISDTEEFVSDENILEDQDEDCQSKCAIQTTIDEFYQIDQIKLEDRIYQSLPLESKPLASPYFAKVPSQFYQDPAQYCKPFQLYRSNVSSVLLKNLTTQPYISSIESNLINFRLTPRSGGITCLEFDPVGVLLAVGSANGLLRVYDSDEILFRTQKQSDIDQR